jgi:hypothetical protein
MKLRRFWPHFVRHLTLQSTPMRDFMSKFLDSKDILGYPFKTLLLRPLTRFEWGMNHESAGIV